jgi:uncharacterized membrane-anchored protein
MKIRAFALLCLSLSAFVARADEPATQQSAADFMASLKPQSGVIELPGGAAKLHLSDDFRYLAPNDAQKLIEQGWGNPPGSAADTLGMLIPAAGNPLEQGGWGVVVTYTEDGHVADDDADKIDYTALLKQMQDEASKANAERSKKGFPTVSLVGWAEPPHYDASEHKIYWAKDLEFGDGGGHTLNYFIRVLGRKGVLELNAVSGMDQLARVKHDMQQVIGFADFSEGSRYTDFNASTDKVAAYGLAALVAGGIAAKAGLFAKLLVLLVAMKKFALLIVAAIAGFFGKLFKRKPANGPVS